MAASRLGTGAGYLKSEFEALGADFDRRGALLDEAIAAWKATWAGVDHDGPEFGVSGHIALPPPLTDRGPPIWIGGNGAAAQRRVVEVADGWMPMAASGEMAAITRPAPTRGRRHARRLDRDGEQAAGGTRAANLPTSRSSRSRPTCSPVATAPRSARPSQPRLDAYAEAGVTWITIEPASRSFTDFRTDVDMLASQLIHR